MSGYPGMLSKIAAAAAAGAGTERVPGVSKSASKKSMHIIEIQWR